jgi:lipopolysaccharide export system ATP-binding protein
MALLEVDGLVKFFGSRAVVNGVSFQVNAGEVVGLLGPNGAGKTTSFRMATGQITPNGGRVTFNDEVVTHLPMYQRARRGMGYLSQEPSVFKKLTVEKNLLAILEALPRSRELKRRLSRRERRERADAALKRFKLDLVRKNVAGRCSGGEKRRLEIARCLVCEPLLILLDEPFAAVDPKTTEDIRANIRELADTGIGILITDHNVREVFRSADRVYLITEGKVVTHGTPHQLVNDQIAIDAYLGRSFEEDGFTRQFAANRAATAPVSTATPTPRPAARPAPAATAVLEEEDVTPEPLFAKQDLPPAPTPYPVTTPPPASHLSSAVVGLLEEQKLRMAVEALGNDATLKQATADLVSRGPVVVPLLLAALEGRDATLRRRAFLVLTHIVRDQGVLDFNPDAPDADRLRQVAHLRNRLERRG